jgi:hypothetical protein
VTWESSSDWNASASAGGAAEVPISQRRKQNLAISSQTITL